MKKAEVMKFSNGTSTSYPILEVVDWVKRPFALETRMSDTPISDEAEF